MLRAITDKNEPFLDKEIKFTDWKGALLRHEIVEKVRADDP